MTARIRQARHLRRFAVLTVLFSVAGCTPQPDEPHVEGAKGPVSGTDRRYEPVVVYADAPGEDALGQVFAAFTAETGIPVTVRTADRARNLQDIMDKTGAPPADVLLTDNVTDIWPAADDGALRGLGAQSGIDGLPEAYRDPDDQWFMLGTSRFVIVRAAGAGNAAPASLADLTDERYARQLCLSTSSGVHNRELIAQLIEAEGVRSAEITVRQWLGNLALPPFESTDKLLDAVAAGSCPLAIAIEREIKVRQGLAEEGEFDSVRPLEVYGTAFAVGIARYARYAESATVLLAWLLGSDGQAAFAEAAAVTPLGDGADLPPKFASVGWRHEEARLLAERAGWR